jgi:hypothetical protein
LSRPGYGDAGEGLGDEEAVPGVGLPCAVGMNVEGSDSGVDEFGQLDDAGFGDLRGTSGAVRGDGAVVSGDVSALQVAQTGGSVARAGAADGDEAETLDSAGDQFAVEAAADENGHAVVAEPPCGGEQAAVPEGIDGWRRAVVAGKGTGIANVFVAEGDAETADDGARQAGDDGEGDALLQGVRRGHEDEFTFPLPFLTLDNKRLRCNI